MSIKIPIVFFTELEQIILKLIWNPKRPQIARVILKKKDKVGGITPPEIKACYKAIVVKGAWHWHGNGHIDLWTHMHRTENAQ